MITSCWMVLFLFKQCTPAGYGRGVYAIRAFDNALLYYNETSTETIVVAQTNYTSLGYNSVPLGALAMAGLDTVNDIYYYAYSGDIRLPNGTFMEQNGIYGYNLTDPSSLIQPILLPMFRQGFVDFSWQMTTNQNNGDL